MLEDVIVVGIVMALTEIIKKTALKSLHEDLTKQIVPLVVLALAGGLNVLNARIFAPDMALTEALALGLTHGAIAGGVYSLGKAALGKS
jgi:hypothetical protein